MLYPTYWYSPKDSDSDSDTEHIGSTGYSEQG